jgi:hypothetical protein
MRPLTWPWSCRGGSEAAVRGDVTAPNAWLYTPPPHSSSGVLTSGPAVAAYPPAPSPVALARGLDGKLWEFRGTWHALGGAKIVGHPAAVCRTKSSIDIFALSESGTLLWRRY